MHPLASVLASWTATAFEPHPLLPADNVGRVNPRSHHAVPADIL